jgi:hypothetical protein
MRRARGDELLRVKTIAANHTTVQVGNVTVLVSYETPVAAYCPDGFEGNGDTVIDEAGNGTPIRFLREDKSSSRTTAKHINRWFASCEAFHSRFEGVAPREWIAKLLTAPPEPGIKINVTLGLNTPVTISTGESSQKGSNRS